MRNEIANIIVQAGGKGTRMGRLTYNKPKALVPIDNLPMLFHLFRKFPECRFLIIGDYKFDVLERYLKAFADVEYELVDARDRKGTCAGIDRALELMPEEEPSMLIWSDLILPNEYQMPDGNINYIGISKDFRCRWQYADGVFEESPSEEHGVAGHFIFKDKKELEGVPEEGEFVRWLSERGKVFEELPLYKTKEYGLYEEYKKHQVSRCRPFNRITVKGDRIIKEGIDAQGRGLAVREKAWYDRVKEKGFVNIPVIYETDPLIMERIDGKNVYEYSLSAEDKEKILEQIVNCIREIHSLGTCPSDENSYREAYIYKTFNRLEKVKDLVPFARDEFIMINGRNCKNVFYMREELEDMIMKYYPDSFCFLHGDCTFSNIMLRNGTTPVVIDPRGYFGTTELYGDPAYDWVKLYYSIAGNYDQFNLKRFELKIEEQDVSLEIESNHWEDMEGSFLEMVKDDVSKEQLELLHSIIYLSLTTYAWEDYDSICGA
ncbi:MAG: phosphotransferase, partial [Lachnospiraceae bacterium]|nr:phosphotransferase [Lachnospiraceae bacterium]